MWAVYKLKEGRRMWYCGINGEWSSVSARACRWPDRRDAQAISSYVHGYVDWLEHRADHQQYIAAASESAAAAVEESYEAARRSASDALY